MVLLECVCASERGLRITCMHHGQEHAVVKVRDVAMQVWSGSAWESANITEYRPVNLPSISLGSRSSIGSTSTNPEPVDISQCWFNQLEGGEQYAKIAQPILTCHYAYTTGTGIEPGKELGLLGKVDAFRNIPTIAIHGRNDIVCPISTAYDLHSAWPEMELQVVPAAGHSQYEPAITHCLVSATDRMSQVAARLFN
jgi:pimeloyl-ACP methyl ester carboxylesterase